jgi:aspartyl-tRNA(Asn)/glutamyl-tRNA(Gln) amidotransferase subunit B
LRYYSSAKSQVWLSSPTFPAFYEYFRGLESYKPMYTVGNTAKSLLSLAFKGETRPISEIVEEQNLLLRPMSQEEYDILAAAVVAEHAAIAEQVRVTGKTGKLNFLVGQLIRRGEKGRVEAQKAEAALRRRLGLQ